MKNLWARAALVSVTVALVMVLAQAILFGWSTTCDPPVPWDEFKDLPYSEAVDLLNERGTERRGISAFLANADELAYWKGLMLPWALTSLACFLACAVLLLWWRTCLPGPVRSDGQTSTGPLDREERPSRSLKRTLLLALAAIVVVAAVAIFFGSAAIKRRIAMNQFEECVLEAAKFSKDRSSEEFRDAVWECVLECELEEYFEKADIKVIKGNDTIRYELLYEREVEIGATIPFRDLG